MRARASANSSLLVYAPKLFYLLSLAEELSAWRKRKTPPERG
jgi:hypothetical protein